MSRLKVGVLMGGRSEERDVSLRTGTGIMNALDAGRYDVIALDTDDPPEPPGSGHSPATVGEGIQPHRSSVPAATGAKRLLDAITGKDRPDVVFIALHGKYGEDGTVQGLLELVNLPYTGSGVLASALAMDKAMSKKLFAAETISTPPFVTLDDAGMSDYIADYFALPLVVKPNQQGSSFGMTIVRRREDLRPAVAHALEFDREALVERYITGVEITAAVLGNRSPEVLPLVEICPKAGIYDTDSKYTSGRTEFYTPARISPEQERMAADYALRAHRVLGCRGVSRVDMMIDDDGIWVLEVNTIPGMTATSLVPKAAAAAGIGYPELCDRMIRMALEER